MRAFGWIEEEKEMGVGSGWGVGGGICVCIQPTKVLGLDWVECGMSSSTVLKISLVTRGHSR